MSLVRERYRAQVRDEVKAIALRRLAASGPAGISVNAIAREIGVSGPALYRYFSSRDALLTELVIDAYDEQAASLERALSGVRGRGARRRFETLARAYRSWAVAHPDRYRLLYGPPLPGYDARAGRLVEAAQKSMNILLEVLRDAPHHPTPEPRRRISPQLARWARDGGADVGPSTALWGIIVWTRLHGLISLEIGGGFARMGIDAGVLFETEVAALAP